MCVYSLFCMLVWFSVCLYIWRVYVCIFVLWQQSLVLSLPHSPAYIITYCLSIYFLRQVNWMSETGVCFQAEMSLTTLVVDGGVWSVFWQRLAQVLRVNNTATDSGLRDVDDEAADVVPSPIATIQPPDWSLLSFSGLSTALNIAIAVFVKVLQWYLCCELSLMWNNIGICDLLPDYMLVYFALFFIYLCHKRSCQLLSFHYLYHFIVRNLTDL